jgi:hypothetical protein
MTFDPRVHLIQLPRKVKDKASGQYITVYDDYLEVKFRLVWFREKFPRGTIETEELCVDLDRGYARYKARVTDGEGGSATGHGTETKADFPDYAERAETRALGRALAALGIGTPFVGAELDELPHVADAPVTPTIAPDAAHEPHGISAQPLPVGEGPSGAPTSHMARPSAEEITTLVESARAAHVDLEAFGHDMRRLMKLPESQKVTKKFLRETMTMAQYNTARAQYGEALRVILEDDVPNHQPPEVPHGNAPKEAAVSQPAAAPTEAPPAGPSPAGSLSAPDPEPTNAAVDPAYHKLYQEALSWGVAESEIKHILGHHEPAKARVILWKARRNEPPPVWEKVPAAAD